MTGLRKVEVFIQEKVWFKNSLSQLQGGDRLGVVQSTETGCGGCEGEGHVSG